MKNIFSYWGVYGRFDFLIFGLIVPFAILFIFAFISDFIQVPWILFVGLAISLYVTLISALKRAREAISNTTMIMIFYVLFPILGLFFLLFQPASSLGKVKI